MLYFNRRNWVTASSLLLTFRPQRRAAGCGRYRVFPNVGCLAVQVERLQSGTQIGEAADRRRPIAAGGGFLTERPVYLGT